jgi:Uma2 family endonuclease
MGCPKQALRRAHAAFFYNWLLGMQGIHAFRLQNLHVVDSRCRQKLDLAGKIAHNSSMGLPQKRMTISEFLAWENEQEGKHEFVQGEVFAMVGARRIHGEIVRNVMLSLGAQLRGKRCRPYSEGMKLQVGESIYSPDAFVTCDERDLRTDQVFRYPTVIAEVLSPSTATYDITIKFAAYRTLPGLIEYLLIDPETKATTLFRRNSTSVFEVQKTLNPLC